LLEVISLELLAKSVGTVAGAHSWRPVCLFWWLICKHFKFKVAHDVLHDIFECRLKGTFRLC